MGNISSIPFFISTNTSNYRLLAESPCRNSGTNQEWMIFTTDLDSNNRIQEGSVDMGCYEYNDSVQTGFIVVYIDPVGSGTVTGGGTWPVGSTQTVVATPNTGYSFVWWNDGITQTQRTVVVPTGGTNLIAYFTNLTYSLTIATNPVAGGTVAPNPRPGANGKYAHGAVVTLTASNKAGYIFSGWSGALTGSGNPQQLTMTADKAVTANFSTATASIILATNPAGSGTVTGGGTYAVGSSQTLTAYPNTGYQFVRWNDGLTQTQRTVVVPASGTNLTAYFTNLTYSLTIATNPAAGGTVAASPVPGVSRSYSHGSVVTLTASARTGYSFTGWSGALTGSGNPQQLTMTTNKAVTANFSTEMASITIVTNPPGSGRVTGGGLWPVGSSQTLVATPSTEYTFIRWQDNVTQSQRTVVVPTGGTNLTAFFLAAAPPPLPLPQRKQSRNRRALFGLPGRQSGKRTGI